MSNGIYYGLNVVKSLLIYKIYCIKKIFLSIDRNDSRLREIKVLINKNFINFDLVKNRYLFRILKNKNINHQGVVAIVNNKKIFFYSKMNLLNIISKKKRCISLVLDRINDPHNLGCCIRNSVSMGVDIIIVSKNRSASIYNNVVHKVSEGSIYNVMVLEVVNLSLFIDFMKNYDFYVIGSCSEVNSNYKYIYNFSYNKYNRICLIFGSENDGIKKNIRKRCDIILRIPILKLDSLNVSVSNALFLYEIFRSKLFY